MSENPVPSLLDTQHMDGYLERLAREISAACGHEEGLVLVGIRSRGLPLAWRLAKKLGNLLGKEVPVGSLDIALYRDDLTEKAGAPIIGPTEIPFSLRNRTVVLVDDVLFTGRTIRAALDALQDFGRPRRVLLAVLVDRGGRELPIQGDFVGLKLEIPRHQRVSVKIAEVDGVDGVFLETKA